jgi:MoxR-like ATPase
MDVDQIKAEVEEQSDHLDRLRLEMGKVVVGQAHMVRSLMIALLSSGHALLEGVPGLAKTTAIKTLADCISTRFQRIQFTPDLLPSDLVGTLIYNPHQGTFTTKQGPIFANLILADEINRAPSKVQSALLEAMQERQVSIGEETFPLEEPFLVLATQNPIEQEGTYPLPEAQVDRFMLKILIDYPEREEERRIVDQALEGGGRRAKAVVTPEQVFAMRDVASRIYMDDRVRDYCVDLVFATRDPGSVGLDDLARLIEYGASPRASIYLGVAGRASAFLAGRGYVTPQDVKDVAHDILRHRVLLTYEAEAEEITADDVIDSLLEKVPVP